MPSIKCGHMAAPSLIVETDYSTFEKTPQERGELWAAKRNHRKALKKAYGKDANKYLNIPEKTLSEPIVNRF